MEEKPLLTGGRPYAACIIAHYLAGQSQLFKQQRAGGEGRGEER